MREISIDKIGAISGAIPMYRVKKIYVPRLIITPEKPTIEYLIKSLWLWNPSLGIFQINSTWSAKDSFESPEDLSEKTMGISLLFAPWATRSHTRED